MPKAGDTFELAIKDAERLLDVFNKLHPGSGHPPPRGGGFETRSRCLWHHKIVASKETRRDCGDPE